MTTIINGTEYELARTLRVAYKVQGQHNHMPYAQVFEKLSDMALEDQIGILYAAFECANPEQAKFITRQKFLDEYLDNYNMKQIMSQIKDVIHGIMGTDDTDEEIAAEGNGNEGN